MRIAPHLCNVTFEKAELSEMDFIICTEDVNRYGYRVLLSGARLDNFKKNPVMLLIHEDGTFPIGRWDNIRFESGQMLATAVFAEGDPVAQRAKNLAEQGMLNATSIGMVPITYSADSTYLLPGQSRETVVEWELLEVSLVPIPANPHTVKLKLSNSADQQEGILPKELQPKQDMNLQDIATRLGLSADATGEQILAAVQALQADNQTLILSLGEQRGVVKEENRQIWATLAAKDSKSTLALIQSLAPAAGPDEEEEDNTTLKAPEAPAQPQGDTVTLEKIFSLVQRNGGQPKSDDDNPDKWDFDTWSKRNPEGLLKMKKQEPEKYKQLAQAYTAKK